MSHSGEQFARDERPTFETALRGYDKRQVDQFVAQADQEIADAGRRT